MLILPPIWASHFKNEKEAFDFFMNQKGEVFRSQKNRKTVRFNYLGAPYFIKIHHAIGWKEILKNWISLKKPVISARQEWEALKKLEKLGIPSLEPVALGEKGYNPATKQSFIITKELSPHCSLVDLFQKNFNFSYKIQLIKKVALLAQQLHEQGMNHRDFYLCHFVVKTDVPFDEGSKIYLMDLHRAQIRKYVPKRWLIKDLSGLYFSAMEIRLSFRDCLRFLKVYRGKKLKIILKEETKFLNQIRKRAVKLYEHSYPKTLA
ncbi:MAG: lipopolysaccharide core heptose(I) kinase RfaP [Gammaproteobacteria bacterium RIFCSPHIGHO2_12_FULL_41_15]|nr:MAG: lipopolysaccharide core heptose(I) kinase RfaP [Gammaproteobacteria bacterium RIFCSPHIGHO2_12_FULL_41_15]